MIGTEKKVEIDTTLSWHIRTFNILSIFNFQYLYTLNLHCLLLPLISRTCRIARGRGFTKASTSEIHHNFHCGDESAKNVHGHVASDKTCCILHLNEVSTHAHTASNHGKCHHPNPSQSILLAGQAMLLSWASIIPFNQRITKSNEVFLGFTGVHWSTRTNLPLMVPKRCSQVAGRGSRYLPLRCP